MYSLSFQVRSWPFLSQSVSDAPGISVLAAAPLTFGREVLQNMRGAAASTLGQEPVRATGSLRPF